MAGHRNRLPQTSEDFNKPLDTAQIRFQVIKTEFRSQFTTYYSVHWGPEEPITFLEQICRHSLEQFEKSVVVSESDMRTYIALTKEYQR